MPNPFTRAKPVWESYAAEINTPGAYRSFGVTEPEDGELGIIFNHATPMNSACAALAEPRVRVAANHEKA